MLEWQFPGPVEESPLSFAMKEAEAVRVAADADAAAPKAAAAAAAAPSAQMKKVVAINKLPRKKISVSEQFKHWDATGVLNAMKKKSTVVSAHQ